MSVRIFNSSQICHLRVQLQQEGRSCGQSTAQKRTQTQIVKFLGSLLKERVHLISQIDLFYVQTVGKLFKSPLSLTFFDREISNFSFLSPCYGSSVRSFTLIPIFLTLIFLVFTPLLNNFNVLIADSISHEPIPHAVGFIVHVVDAKPVDFSASVNYFRRLDPFLVFRLLTDHFFEILPIQHFNVNLECIFSIYFLSQLKGGEK